MTTALVRNSPLQMVEQFTKEARHLILSLRAAEECQPWEYSCVDASGIADYGCNHFTSSRRPEPATLTPRADFSPAERSIRYFCSGWKDPGKSTMQLAS